MVNTLGLPLVGKDVGTKHNKSAIARKEDGNPEGKGVSAFMLDWHQSQPYGVVAKPHRQLLAEFFTSMLVLSATFKFRPVVGKSYYLYWFNDEWSLSPIAPQQWSDQRRAAFAGICSLQQDMTWTIEPSEVLINKNPVSEAMSRFYEIFAATLDTDRMLVDVLPFYVDNMPYYQRLYASALSRSVNTSMQMGEQSDDDCQSWRTLLPDSGNLLTSTCERSSQLN